MSEQPFRFLDLPIELRFCVYEFLSLEIKHHTFRFPLSGSNVQLTAVKRSFPLAILGTCRTIRTEAEDIVGRGRNLVLNAPPRIIANFSLGQRDVQILHLITQAIALQLEYVSQHGMDTVISPATADVSAALSSLIQSST
jgi:hypothetical protein